MMLFIERFGLVAIAAILVAAGSGASLGSAATAVSEAERQAGPAEVVGLEKSAHEAWKTKNSKFWTSFLADKFIGWGSSGRLDKTSATDQYTGADCGIRSDILSGEQVRRLGGGVALITYKEATVGACDGQAVPAESSAASVYVRDGHGWKAAFHAADAVVEPKAAAVKSDDGKTLRV